MTEIRIQKVSIPRHPGDKWALSCEEWIAREYFQWGGGNHWGRMREQDRNPYVRRGFNNYDGFPVPQDNELTLADVWMTRAIYSRVSSKDADNLMKHGRELLAALPPPDVSLIDVSEAQISMACDAIQCFCKKTHGISWSKATKVLHKKRPLFVPPIDDHVYWTLTANFPHLFYGSDSSKRSCLAEYLKLFQSICAFLRDRLKDINGDLKQRWSIELPEVRVASFLFYQWYKKKTIEQKAVLWTQKGIADFWEQGSPMRRAVELSREEARKAGLPVWGETVDATHISGGSSG